LTTTRPASTRHGERRSLIEATRPVPGWACNPARGDSIPRASGLTENHPTASAGSRPLHARAFHPSARDELRHHRVWKTTEAERTSPQWDETDRRHASEQADLAEHSTAREGDARITQKMPCTCDLTAEISSDPDDAGTR
jgi:hypothetical protein